MAQYTVHSGETLIDICYNTTGSLAAINSIMNANNIGSYTQQIAAGTVITVPDVVYNSAAVSSAKNRPFNNTFLPDEETNSLVSTFNSSLRSGSLSYTFSKISTTVQTQTLNLVGFTGMVNWGDGTVEHFSNSSNVSHTYSYSPLNFTITAYGTATGLNAYLGGSKISNVTSFSMLNADKIFITDGCSINEAFDFSPDNIDCKFGNTPIVSVNNSFNTINYGNNGKIDYLFANMKNLTDAMYCCYNRGGISTNMVSAVGLFKGDSALLSTSNCLMGYSTTPIDITDIYAGCTSLQDVSNSFENTFLHHVPVSIFDDSKNVTDFTGTFVDAKLAFESESPYTMVNGVKVKLWMRSPEYGFATPVNFSDCFKNSNFTDIDEIPTTWGGNLTV